MIRGVDVLAVMERDAELALSWNGRAKEESQIAFRESQAAHRAVAELIEAVEQKLADAEQGYFEEWLESGSPSGDHEEVQRKWLNSYPYEEFILEWGEQVSALARVRGAA